MSTSCLVSLLGICNKHCTFLHPILGSAGWLYCVRGSGPKFGSVTTHYVFRSPSGSWYNSSLGTSQPLEASSPPRSQDPLPEFVGSLPVVVLEGTDSPLPRILSNMFNSAPSYSFFHLTSISQDTHAHTPRPPPWSPGSWTRDHPGSKYPNPLLPPSVGPEDQHCCFGVMLASKTIFSPIFLCFIFSPYLSLLFIFILFVFSRAAPVAHGASEARGLIGATAASLYNRHSNSRSFTH